jgi:electron transfer flavoprotein alpha subunit
MAEVLVLVELNPDGSGVRKTTLEALTAARALGGGVDAVFGLRLRLQGFLLGGIDPF